MTSNWFTVLIAIISGGYLIGVAGLIVAITGRKKTKADALSIIEGAAASQVKRMEDEAEKWRNECLALRGEVGELSGKVEETTVCQKDLKGKIEVLEREKKNLMDRVTRLTEQVEELQEENKRLKQDRDNEKEGDQRKTEAVVA